MSGPPKVRRHIKVAIGWLLWTIGGTLYGLLTTSVALPTNGELSALEFALGTMMVGYLFGVPVLTGLWIAEDS